MTSTQPKILLTGSTGYIGGSILAHLLDSSSGDQFGPITCLIRGEDRVAKLRAAYGDRVDVVLYEGLDDTEATREIASQHDIVINTTNGYHAASGEALVRGLAKRKASTGRDVWMIHTSGTSNLADQPISGKWIEKPTDREFDDAKDDMYAYEKMREAQYEYPQRTAELGVIDTGVELGVKTIVIMSPTIYGNGSGLFNTKSIQIPILVRGVLAHGRGLVIGEGKGVWDHVHVEDLAELYKLVALEIIKDGGKRLPSGRKGIIFSGNGRHTWLEVTKGVTNACYEEGTIPDNKVESLSLDEGTKVLSPHFGGIDATVIEFALCSNSRTVSNVGRSLGWKPTRGDEAWTQGFKDDLKAVVAQ